MVEHLYNNEDTITEQSTRNKLGWRDFLIMLVLAIVGAVLFYGWPMETRTQPPTVITLTKYMCRPTPTPTQTPPGYLPYWRP